MAMLSNHECIPLSIYSVVVHRTINNLVKPACICLVLGAKDQKRSLVYSILIDNFVNTSFDGVLLWIDMNIDAPSKVTMC